MQRLLSKSSVFTLAAVLLCWQGMCANNCCLAQPADYKGVVAGKEATVLHLILKPLERTIALPKSAKVIPLNDLQFTGPRPSHPFVLGNYATDGKWAIVNGQLRMVEGKNAALQLAWADEFELDGIMDHSGYGGWFLLMGWNDGRGYALSNVNLKESGSPWFLSEFRGGKATDDRTKEFDKFDWKGEQPFRLEVKDEALTLEVGKFKVLNKEPIAGYSPGMVTLGVYDTRYGPKPLGIKSLRIRALVDEPATPKGGK